MHSQKFCLFNVWTRRALRACASNRRRCWHLLTAMKPNTVPVAPPTSGCKSTGRGRSDGVLLSMLDSHEKRVLSSDESSAAPVVRPTQNYNQRGSRHSFRLPLMDSRRLSSPIEMSSQHLRVAFKRSSIGRAPSNIESLRK